MTRGLRWRIFVLQVGLIGILAFVAGFLFWAHSFDTSQIQTQLTEQQITFPTAGSAALKALPKAQDAAMTVYADQQLVNGDQAQTYANDFINVHLSEIGGGKTYSQLSAELQADPNNAKLSGTVATVFKGETLRGLLLNSYGWWTVGTYALYAGIGMVIAAFAVFLAFVFEIFSWRKTISRGQTA